MRRSFNAEVEKQLQALMKADGWWKCTACSNDDFLVFHRPEETHCPATDTPRIDCEYVEAPEETEIELKRDDENDLF